MTRHILLAMNNTTTLESYVSSLSVLDNTIGCSGLDNESLMEELEELIDVLPLDIMDVIEKYMKKKALSPEDRQKLEECYVNFYSIGYGEHKN